MKNNNSSDWQSAPPEAGFSPWQLLKSKRISYLTLPLLIMATITEFVILATGWKYQQIACLPKGMGVTFFGIGPIGATILAVELLKLPLAIWTASRTGWQKGIMIMAGLPLICILTFQLVKDMAVYEMGIAMAPAGQMLDQATQEENKIVQLNGELALIKDKKEEREQKLAALASKKAKFKADLEESLKRNGDLREDAISLTDYQKKELSGVEARQSTIIKQFDADTEQLTKAVTDLRGRREAEMAHATKWNAEEARIENDYQTKAAEYANKKAAYEKDKAVFENANYLKRHLMKEPVDPGVPPGRESNTILKPTLIAELDAQIQAKEAELLAVNNRRRDRVAQVESEAHQLRQEFDRRSSTKREESDRKREQLLAAQATLAAEWAAEEKLIDQGYEAAVQKVDLIRAELDASQKKAQAFYEARETAIKNTQVHRIATTVEIVRSLLLGQRPVSIRTTAKERGDLYTDQISMVRVWVYPVLAFIVAFLPTLMVEVGFSTLFKSEHPRPPYRLGLFGHSLHRLYTRAGRQKILRADRLAREATGEIARRDEALVSAQAEAQKTILDKDAQLQAARQALADSAAAHEDQLKKKSDEWVAKLALMADSLNRAIIEKDALRDLQKSEIDRQIQMRQNAWSDRLTQLRQELDEQRAAAETERTALIQEHHRKLMEVSEEAKTQVVQARRQLTEAELAGLEKNAALVHDLKEALHARDSAETELKHLADSQTLKLAQLQDEAARELEKAARQERHRAERQQLEFEQTLHQREEDSQRRLKQREQDLTLGFEARLVAEQTRIEDAARRREAELARQFEARAVEADARWKQEAQQREAAAETRLKHREQQLQAQTEVRLGEIKTQADLDLRQRESDFVRQLEAQTREADARLRHELQQKELALQAKLKQREQELAARAAARETEWQNQSAADLLARQEEWELQTALRVRAVETRLAQEFMQKEEVDLSKFKQREQELVLAFDARLVAEQSRIQEDARRRELELARQSEARDLEADARWQQELQQREEAAEIRLKQREQQLMAQTDVRLAEIQTQSAQELRRRESDLQHQFETQSREADARFRHELQQKELALQTKLKQREQELAARAAARETELHQQAAADLLARQEEWQRQSASRLAQDIQAQEESLLSKLKQREQELALAFESRLTAEQARIEDAARRRESELGRQIETRWKQELQQREEAAETRLKQREQQLQAQTELRLAEIQTVAAEDLRKRESEFDRLLEVQSREADARFRQELQQKELALQTRLKQREQDLASRAATRETELQNQAAADLLARQDEWERQTDSRIRATEARLAQEAQQQEELFQSKSRQIEQHWQAKLDSARIEAQSQTEQALRRRELESADALPRALREQEARLRQELNQQMESIQTRSRQREQDLAGQLAAQSAAHQSALQNSEIELAGLRRSIEPFKALLAHTEKERDEARLSASEGIRQMQDLEKKLTEASSLLNGWKTDKHVAPSRSGKEAFQFVRGGLGATSES